MDVIENDVPAVLLDVVDVALVVVEWFKLALMADVSSLFPRGADVVVDDLEVVLGEYHSAMITLAAVLAHTPSTGLAHVLLAGRGIAVNAELAISMKSMHEAVPRTVSQVPHQVIKRHTPCRRITPIAWAIAGLDAANISTLTAQLT